jgi:hypothetical protein
MDRITMELTNGEGTERERHYSLAASESETANGTSRYSRGLLDDQQLDHATDKILQAIAS